MSEPLQIATDFAQIPFDDHEAKILALAYLGVVAALQGIHEYHCGCDQPGRFDLCVAQPVDLFAVLGKTAS